MYQPILQCQSDILIVLSTDMSKVSVPRKFIETSFSMNLQILRFELFSNVAQKLFHPFPMQT